MEEFGPPLRFALVGIGATLFMDLWALLLRTLWGVSSLDYALVGRWVGHMRSGRLFHASIGKAEPIRFERPLGWALHYAIGVVFALAFGGFVGLGWLAAPRFPIALAFGALTALVPFLIMQPAFGFGLAASKTPTPLKARAGTLNAHLSFGLGLYLAALAVRLAFPPL